MIVILLSQQEYQRVDFALKVFHEVSFTRLRKIIKKLPWAVLWNLALPREGKVCMIFQDFQETFTFSNHTHWISYSFRYRTIISTGLRTEIILLTMLNLWLPDSFLDLESPATLLSDQNFNLDRENSQSCHCSRHSQKFKETLPQHIKPLAL